MNSYDDIDFDFMQKVKKGDVLAFKKLIDRHQNYIINIARKMLTCNVQDAEEIAQMVFIRIWKAAPDYKSNAKFTTWMFTIMRNLIFNESKKRKRFKNTYSVDDEDNNFNLQDSEFKRPDKVLEQSEVANAVASSIAKLPKNQRLAVILWRYHDLSYAEIAERMEVSVPSVKSLIFRARQALKNHLKDYL